MIEEMLLGSIMFKLTIPFNFLDSISISLEVYWDWIFITLEWLSVIYVDFRRVKVASSKFVRKNFGIS